MNRFASARVVGLCVALGACTGAIGGDSGSDRGNGSGREDGACCGGGGGDEGPAGGSGVLSCEGRTVAPTLLGRMTREHYKNTVEDLFGIATDAAAAIAADEKVGAFNTNVNTPITESQAEQYMAVAETIADQAIGVIDTFLPCDPNAVGAEACASQFISTFGLRFHRRPLTITEQQQYEGLFAIGNGTDGFAGGIRLVIQAMLQSPYFLYHVEFGVPEQGDSAIAALDDYEMASRLSYFLWNSLPDDELFSAAQAGQLREPATLRSQAERMLDDPRAKRAIGSFHRQWLGLDNLASVEKDPEMFPTFDAAMRDAMQSETVDFADHVIRSGDGRLETLLTAPWSILSDPLFGLYQVEKPANFDPSQPVDLDPTERSGILTQAGLLAMQAHAKQGSPVKRGVLIRQNFLCQTLPPPPPNVNNTPPVADPTKTTRERFDEHTKNPECASCHVLIDGIGLAFEHYDAIGAYRDEENGKDVNASGELVNTDDIDGTFDGVIELGAKLASSDMVRECVATQWLRFALARMEGTADACSIQTMVGDFSESDYDLRELLLAIVTTDAFRYRTTATQDAGDQQ